VIRAGEKLGVAAVGAAHPVATVATEIQKGAETPAQIPAQDDRLFSHIHGNEVAGMRHLAFVAEVEPTAGEEMLALQLVDLPVSKDTPVHQTAFRINKRLDFHPDYSFGLHVSSKEHWALNPLLHYSTIPALQS
jgi:hypothetical protein